MRFDTVMNEKETHYFIDGYPVPKEVFDAFRPSKMFPEATMPVEEAEAKLNAIKAEIDAMPKPERDFPYMALAITTDKPICSSALAIHPSQREEAKARNKRHGINVDYDAAGCPVLTDPNVRKKLMKLEGARDLHSYYGY